MPGEIELREALARLCHDAIGPPIDLFKQARHRRAQADQRIRDIIARNLGAGATASAGPVKQSQASRSGRRGS